MRKCADQILQSGFNNWHNQEARVAESFAAKKEGLSDFWEMKKFFRTASVLKSAPSWSAPVAVWKMLLHPNLHRKEKKHGVGFNDEPMSADKVRHALQDLCS